MNKLFKVNGVEWIDEHDEESFTVVLSVELNEEDKRIIDKVKEIKNIDKDNYVNEALLYASYYDNELVGADIHYMTNNSDDIVVYEITEKELLSEIKEIEL